MNQNDDETEGQTGHAAIINDSWLRAREHIRHAEGADLNPNKALWQLEPKEPGYPRALAAHTAIIQMRDDIYAFREISAQVDVSDLWSKQLGTVPIDGRGDVAVSLESLDGWAHEHLVSTAWEEDPVRGRIKTDTKYRVLLPISSCRAVYRQMQDILRELGLAAETKEYTPEGEAQPEHLVGLLDERSQEDLKGQLPERFTAGRGDS